MRCDVVIFRRMFFRHIHVNINEQTIEHGSACHMKFEYGVIIKRYDIDIVSLFKNSDVHYIYMYIHEHFKCK